MGLSIKFLECNGLCASCYETKIRAEHPPRGYNIEAVRKTFREESLKIKEEDRKKRNTPCIHGGEPLLIKIEDLEGLITDSVELYGKSGIQTNGLLIENEHIELFKKYGTHIGVSIDGDTAGLNFGRWNAKLLGQKAIETGTKLTMDNIEKCVKAGLHVSAIVILRKYNAGTPERLNQLKQFLFRLANLGVTNVRMNQVIVYDKDLVAREQLTEVELGNAFTFLGNICFDNPNFEWRPFRDVVELLKGNYNQTCVFSECDIWRTNAEQPIDAWGNVGNCLKGGGSIDGLQVLAADRYSNERYVVLPQIHQTEGGCKGCEFWVICKGGCPGEGIDNDWRNRSRFCGGLKALYKFVAHRLRGIEPGRKLSIDKTPDSQPGPVGGHGDSPHGDHTDEGKGKR